MPSSSMPLSSTIRTDGRPSGVAVASAIRSASMIPEAAASSNQSLTCARGELPRRASGPSSEVVATIRVALERHRDVLDVQVLVDALGTALAAEAGGLDAAERRRRVGDHALVEADHAGLELLDHPERALDVARVDVGDEPVLGVVGGGDRRVLVVEADDRRDRPEDLLLEQPRALRHAAEHGRLVEVAGALARAPADQDLRALAGRVRDELGDLAALVVVDQRADLDVVLGAAPDLQ